MKNRALQDAHLAAIKDTNLGKRLKNFSFNFNNESEKKTAYRMLQSDLTQGSLNNGNGSDWDLF